MPKPPGTKHLILKCDELLSSFAFDFNFRRYNVGQRIRDEILAVQQANGCKGGFMEEWHQKLHNNTSPDDVDICEAGAYTPPLFGST